MPFTLRPCRRFPVQCAVMYRAGSFLKLPLAYISCFWSLIIVLILSSVPAYAEWVAIGDIADQGLTVYADPDTIRRKGDLVKMWSLLDFKTPQGEMGSSYLSSREQRQYDCTEERDRLLALTTFSGNMGTGKVGFIFSEEHNWVPDAPGTVGQTLWKFACSKK